MHVTPQPYAFVRKETHLRVDILSAFNFFAAPNGEPGNALLNWRNNPSSDLIDYAISYRWAAMALVAFRERQGDTTIDNGALPIVFLYRHSFELYLKAIVYRAAAVTIDAQELERAIPRLWREHSLARLVKMAEPILCARTRPLTASGDLYGGRNIACIQDRRDRLRLVRVPLSAHLPR